MSIDGSKRETPRGIEAKRIEPLGRVDPIDGIFCFVSLFFLLVAYCMSTHEMSEKQAKTVSYLHPRSHIYHIPHTHPSISQSHRNKYVVNNTPRDNTPSAMRESIDELHYAQCSM